jgi:hypothetical protein
MERQADEFAAEFRITAEGTKCGIIILEAGRRFLCELDIVFAPSRAFTDPLSIVR